MPQLSKISIPVAANKKTKLDLSCDHVTSGNFMILQPCYYRHMIAGERLDINALCSARLAPMAVPTYGRMRINMRGFFVPFRTIFPQWNNFYSDVIGSNASASSLVSKSPTVSNSVLRGFLLKYVTEVTMAASIQNGEWDIHDSNSHYYNFTYEGRNYYKVLQSLGYRVNFNAKDDSQYSALALLAYAKVYLDWYANSQYLDSSAVLRLSRLLAYNDPSGNLELTVSDISDITFFTRFVVYDGDYFVSAWERPNAPVATQQSSFTFLDPTSTNGVSVSSNSMGTPEMTQSAATALSVGTQYAHDALKRLSDFCKRNQLAGNIAIDRYLARFGINLDSAKANRCIYVGAKSIDVNVGDVTSMANTAEAGDPSNLGDFAGRGFAQDDSKWTFTTDEFGIFLVCYSILPSGGYYQGFDRNNMHVAKKDFFVPEFDGMGVQTIEKREVYVSPDGNFGTGSDYSLSFGFTGRYGEYKRPVSWVTGDLAFRSAFDGGDSWHLMRQFSDASFGSVSAITHSLGFTQGSDFANYSRIFQYTGSDVDKFYINFHFDVGAYAPCTSLFDSYEFEPSNKSVTLDANGTKLN